MEVLQSRSDRRRALAAFPLAWRAPVEELLKAQLELLEESRRSAGAWLERRQEGMAIGCQTLQALATCRDPYQAAEICSEWLKGGVNRICSDLTEARRGYVKGTEILQRMWENTSKKV